MNKRLQQAKEILAGHPDVTSIGLGYRYKDGKKTGEKCTVVGVQKKLPTKDVPRERLIPLTLVGHVTDVQEMDLKALSIPLPSMTAMPAGPINPRGLVQRMRPCPPGFSIGHVKISAGTLGAYVEWGQSDEWRILTNNHVAANSNDAQPNDVIIQPGKADGGFSGTDQLAWLEEFAVIKWDGDDGGKKKAAKFLWSVWKAPANAVARLVRCPYRLQVQRPFAVEQPHPNLVDAAIARPVSQGHVKLDYPFGIGERKGIRDLELGDAVQKVGRTTEHTVGTVEGVQTMTKVQYGAGKIATFEDQIVIRSDAGEFSAGGDSGSAILTMDGYIGGLLFAGSSGADPVTIANKFSHVVSILGVRL